MLQFPLLSMCSLLRISIKIFLYCRYLYQIVLSPSASTMMANTVSLRWETQRKWANLFNPFKLLSSVLSPLKNIEVWRSILKSFQKSFIFSHYTLDLIISGNLIQTLIFFLSLYYFRFGQYHLFFKRHRYVIFLLRLITITTHQDTLILFFFYFLVLWHVVQGIINWSFGFYCWISLIVVIQSLFYICSFFTFWRFTFLLEVLYSRIRRSIVWSAG